MFRETKRTNNSKVATYAPMNVCWFKLNNSHDDIIHFIASPELYRKNMKETSNSHLLELDISKLNEIFPDYVTKIRNIDVNYTERLSKLCVISSAIMNSNIRTQICMSSWRDIKEPTKYLQQSFKLNDTSEHALVLQGPLLHHTHNPFTLNQSFVFGRESFDNKFRAILQKVILLYTLFIFRNNKPLSWFINQLSKITYYDGNHNVHFMEILNAVKIQDFIAEGATQTDIKSLLFLKAVILLSWEDIMVYARSRLSYSNDYKRDKNNNEIIIWRCMGCPFETFYTDNDVEFIRTPAYNQSLVFTGYNIYNKLRGLITLGELEKRLTSTNHKIHATNIIAPKSGEYMVKYDNGTWQFTYVKKNNIYHGIKLMNSDVEYHDKALSNRNDIMDANNFHVNKLVSIFHGSQKLFNIPFLLCSWYDIDLFGLDLDLEFTKYMNNPYTEKLCKDERIYDRIEAEYYLTGVNEENILIYDDIDKQLEIIINNNLEKSYNPEYVIKGDIIEDYSGEYATESVKDIIINMEGITLLDAEPGAFDEDFGFYTDDDDLFLDMYDYDSDEYNVEPLAKEYETFNPLFNINMEGIDIGLTENNENKHNIITNKVTYTSSLLNKDYNCDEEVLVNVIFNKDSTESLSIQELLTIMIILNNLNTRIELDQDEQIRLNKLKRLFNIILKNYKTRISTGIYQLESFIFKMHAGKLKVFQTHIVRRERFLKRMEAVNNIHDYYVDDMIYTPTTILSNLVKVYAPCSIPIFPLTIWNKLLYSFKSTKLYEVLLENDMINPLELIMESLIVDDIF